MTPRLADLPDLILLNIFNRLPTWKILQLAKLCHRLNNIKQIVFRKQTQLRLLGDCRFPKYYLECLKKLQHYFGQNEVEFNFDLILKFDHEPTNYNNYDFSRVIEMIKLSHDIHIQNLEQITAFAKTFPNLKRLTVVFSYFWGYQLLGQLLRNWPNLTHLYFVNFQGYPRDSLDREIEYNNSIMEINNLHNLQVLVLHSPDARREYYPLKIIEPLLLNSTKLHTLYFLVGFHTRLDGRHIVFDGFFPGNNISLQISFDRFKRFGLADYHPNRLIGDMDSTELFGRKTTRLEVSIHTGIRHLINWTALQYLSLKIVSLRDISLSKLFNILVGFSNLHEFHLITNSNIPFRMPLESLARQLPQLPSVRRFEFSCKTSPQELYRFKWALPNVAELRLRLYNSIQLIECEDLESFSTIVKDEYGDMMPESCIMDMKRAFNAHGSEIQYYYWIYYRNGRKGDGVAELVPMVERYTKMIAGGRRINWDLEEIEQIYIDVN